MGTVASRAWSTLSRHVPRTVSRPDLFLLLSLLFVMFIYPVLERTGLGRVIVGFAIFVPLIFATIEMAELKGWGWRALLLIGCILVLSVVGAMTPNPIITSAKWAFVAVLLLLSVMALFSYLWGAHVVNSVHLYTATSIYLLLAFFWFALYSAIDAVYPAAFLHSATGPSDRPSDLLYFSLITLTTSGYGDILPVSGEVRMLAAVEAVTGVLYVAILVALLVSAYRQPRNS